MTLHDKNDSNAVHHWNYLSRQWDIERPSSNAEAWWIENSKSLPTSDPGHLCELCRRINFKLLFHEPEIYLPCCSDDCFCIDLGPLVQTLQRPECALCRVISKKTPSIIFAGGQKISNIDPDTSVRLSVVITGSAKVLRLRIRLSNLRSSTNEDFSLQELGNEPGQGQ